MVRGQEKQQFLQCFQGLLRKLQCLRTLHRASQVALVGKKKPACQRRRHERPRFDPWVGRIPWRRAWQHTPAFLPGESHGQRSLAGYSPWGHQESDTTERLNNNSPGSLHADCSGQGLTLHLTQECMSFTHGPELMATRGWVGASQSQAHVQQTLLHTSRVQPP